jgi:hypothetical protein
MEEMFAEGGCTMSACEVKLHTSFPTDLRTPCKSLQLEANTITYAKCPKCLHIYPLKMSGKVTEWPLECTWRRFLASDPYSACLVKSGVQDGESIRVPILPFVVHDFNSFVGRLLS